MAAARQSLREAVDDPAFPYVITTYRLTEHHTAGGMTRWLSWLAELQPEMFCEVSPELATERGLTKRRLGDDHHRTHGDRSSRAGYGTAASAAHQGPCHPPDRPAISLGQQGPGPRDSANDLISFVADPNVSIQESKALTGNIRAGRRR